MLPAGFSDGDKQRGKMPKRVRFNQVVTRSAERLGKSGFVPSFAPGESIVTFSKEVGDAFRAEIRFVRRTTVDHKRTFHVDVIRWRPRGIRSASDHGLSVDFANILYGLGLGMAPLGDEYGWFTFADENSLSLKVKAVEDLLARFAVPLLEDPLVSNENVMAMAAKRCICVCCVFVKARERRARQQCNLRARDWASALLDAHRAPRVASVHHARPIL